MISANSAWFLANFRSGLIRALVARGWPVVAAAPPDATSEARLTALGCRFAAIPVDAKGISPVRDLRTILAYRALFRRARPAAFIGSTVKANVYGNMAARVEGVPTINEIAGLGTAFIERSWLTPVVEALYRVGLARAYRVLFLNRADRDLFVSRGLVREAQARLVPGSGIDLDRFSPEPRTPGGGTRLLLVARLLRDKGVREFVEVARRIRRARPDVRFQILGPVGAANRTAIGRGEVDGWVAEGAVEYLGETDDVRPFLADADAIVLPSYREGTSQVLLEGAATGRPLIASDVPGCREVLDDGVNGFLCAPRDPDSLQAAVERLLALPGDARAAMGQAGRRKVEREFAEPIVIAHYLRELDALRADR